MINSGDDRAILDDLRALNRRFLRLAPESVPGPAAVSGRALAELDGAARARLVALPFPLFSFGFDTDPGWEELRSGRVKDAVAPAPGDFARERFTVVALTFLRQAVRQHPRRAAALTGIPHHFGDWLAGLELGALAVLAPAAAETLRWRFQAREDLWLNLVAACSVGDGALLQVLRAAGVQWTIRRALSLGDDECTGAAGFRTPPA